MGDQDKFCLRWNDFESNISVAFRELREDKDFFDVTLACDDDQIQAHKVILSACSPFFRQILKRNRHDHPLLYLKGVKYIDLMSVLNFMYHGEVNVAQDELNSFLSIAEDLKVKGLTQNKSNEEPRHKQEIQLPVPQPRPPPERREHTPPPHKRQRPVSVPEPVMHIPAPQPFPQDDDIQEVVPIKSEPVSHAQEEHREDPHQAVVDTRVDNQISMYEENYENYEAYEEGADASYDTSMMSANADANKGEEKYEEILRSMIEKVNFGSAEETIQCKICNRSFKSAQMSNLKNHIEAKHIDHVRFTCIVCCGIFSSKTSFDTHTRNFHKDGNAQFTVTALSEVAE